MTERPLLPWCTLTETSEGWYFCSTHQRDAEHCREEMEEAQSTELIASMTFDKHPYTCEWCEGEWADYLLYDRHFELVSLTVKDHPYQNPNPSL